MDDSVTEQSREAAEENVELAPNKSRKPYPCSHCKSGYSHQDNLTRHLRSKHKELIPYGCRLCQKKFFDRDVLTRHIARFHKRKSPEKHILENQPDNTAQPPVEEAEQDQLLDFGGFGEHFLLGGPDDKATTDDSVGNGGHNCTVCFKSFHGRQAKSSLKRH